MSDKVPHSNDLIDFLAAQSTELASEYERISKRTKEDPGTAGDQGELNWADLLRKWLPPKFRVVTKGRILGVDGCASPQVDILILTDTYPEFLLNKNLYLAGGVLAAFECKITLNANHVNKGFETAKAINNLSKRQVGSPFREAISPIYFGLLAHSHSWKRDTSRPDENITSALSYAHEHIVQHPREMLDVLCVADLGIWHTKKIVVPSWVPSLQNCEGGKKVSEQPLGA